jgi:gamma-glutamylcysteine synthetase
MDVPMYFVYRDGQYINALGQSWRDFMAGKLAALPGGRAPLAASAGWAGASGCWPPLAGRCWVLWRAGPVVAGQPCLA